MEPNQLNSMLNDGMKMNLGTVTDETSNMIVEHKATTSGVAGERIKRPLNSFMIWSQEERRRLHKIDPSRRHTDISTQLGILWRSMTEAEKAPFEEKAEKEKILHRQQYPDYKYQPRRKLKKSQEKENVNKLEEESRKRMRQSESILIHSQVSKPEDYSANHWNLGFQTDPTRMMFNSPLNGMMNGFPTLPMQVAQLPSTPQMLAPIQNPMATYPYADSQVLFHQNQTTQPIHQTFNVYYPQQTAPMINQVEGFTNEYFNLMDMPGSRFQ